MLEQQQLSFLVDVTPLVGVWIEIQINCRSFERMKVTPLVGVWIEIVYFKCNSCHKGSLPLWECGLKSVNIYYGVDVEPSLPLWECGLKSKWTGYTE